MSRSRADWLAEGIEAGWCSDVVCLTHDGVPMSAEEAGQWEDGDDPCAAVVRVDGKWNHGKGEC